MGNQPATQEEKHVEGPVICCGDNPRKQPLEQASPNVMNLGRNTQSSLIKSFSKGGLQNQQNLNMQDTGSTYYKDQTIVRRPENVLEQTNSTNQKYPNQNQPNFNNHQSEMKKSGVSTFKKSYGGFNTFNSMGAYNSYGMHNSKLTEAKQQDPKNHKPLPLADFVGQKDIRRSRVQNNSAIIGLGRYCGPVQQFDSNKKIIEFLQYNHIKDPQFKFYDTKDHQSLLNTSTIALIKKKNKNDMYLDEASTSNIQLNSNLGKLQDAIEVTLDVDSKIILATFILALGGTVLGLGIHFSNGTTDVVFFVCLMVFIFLYIIYLLMCYIYSDVLQYLYNVRQFSNFNEDFEMLRKQNGNFAFHLDLISSRKHIKQCYLLSKDNPITKIREVQNQNRALNIKDLAGKKCTTLMIKFKTKTTFADPESQFNTLNYFDQFLNSHKDQLFERGKTPQKQSQKASNEVSKSKVSKDPALQHPHQRHYKTMLRSARFDYELDAIPLFTKRPQSVVTICYMDQDDGGCTLFFFVICTLFGFCLPFLIIFQSYAKRYRINLLNKFRI